MKRPHRRNKAPSRMRSSNTCFTVLLAFTVASFANPFASPPSVVVGTSSNNNNICNKPSSSCFPTTSTQPISSSKKRKNAHSSDNNRSSARYVASAETSDYSSSSSEKRKKPSSSIRRFLSRLSLSSGKANGRYKLGEHGATVPSRLLFRYVSPLLDLASTRRLDVDDSFHVSSHRKMDNSVSNLARIYDGLRSKSRKRIEEQKKLKRGSEKVKDSQSLLLLKALFLSQRRLLLLTGVLRLLNTCIQAFPAVLVARLLRCLESGDSYRISEAVSATLLLVSVLVTKMVLENQFFHNIVTYGTQLRGEIAGLLFDKSLRLPGGGSSVARKEKNNRRKNNKSTEQAALGTGGVLNLMQSDASIIENAAMQVHTLWDGPLQIALYTSLLFRYLGPCVIWGIAVLLTVIPINSICLRILSRLSIAENNAKDARTKRTTEAITNMKLLKLQGWGPRFADDIGSNRNAELSRHTERGLVRAVNQAISNSVPALVLVVTLTKYVKSGRPIVASAIFTAISLFNQLRYPLFFYPMLIDSLANGKNALRRLSTYLSAEEITPYVQKIPPNPNGEGSIEMNNGNFLWSLSRTSSVSEDDDDRSAGGGASLSAAPALSNVNLRVNPGEVVAVVGPVGSGKSALIKGLLGELVPVPRTVIEQSIAPGSEGSSSSSVVGSSSSSSSDKNIIDHSTVVTQGNVAYCSQEAWLPKGTIRDAVTFGREYDESRYMAAIRDAGLDKDIVSSSSAGATTTTDGPAASSKAAAASGVLSHDTDVGEGGSSLSGGQRARVALARALYCGDDTKVFLLDDCLAALDASVGSTVFERVTQRLRNSGSATVIVTNDPSLPRRCDRVVLMGKITGTCSSIIDTGTYDELIARGHKLRSFSSSDGGDNGDDDDASGGPNQAIDGEGLAEEEHPDHPPAMEIETPKILRLRKKDTIRVVGGYAVPTNSTGCCSHADPDCETGMEHCPDYIADHVVPVSPDIDEEEEITVVDRSSHKRSVATKIGADGGIASSSSAAASSSVALTKSGEAASSTAASSEQRRGKLQSADDTMSAGAVPRSTYVSYFKAVRNPLLIVGLVLSFLTANGAQFYQQYVVAKWTEIGTDGMAVALGGQYLSKLANAAGVVSLFLFVRSFLNMRVGVKASELFHRRMLRSVFSAPMSFFDATPSGQLISRFGKEMETIDRAVPDSISSTLYCFLQMFMASASLAGVVTPAMVVPLFLVGTMYYKTMSRFRPAARDMKRAETKSRSPIYTHFGEALRGTEIIRSIPGARGTWSNTHRTLMDVNLAAYYTVKAFDRWLACRLETLGNVIVFTAAASSAFLTRMGRLKPGSAGWGLTQALAVTGLLTWAVRCLTDLETHMMSVMRVKELTDLDREEIRVDHELLRPSSAAESQKDHYRVPKEKSQAGEALLSLFPKNNNGTSVVNTTALVPVNEKALAGWPWQGTIAFRNVSMRYNPISPLVLKGVTVDVPPGSTLGVVGRTGSGKSSLLLTLFRLVEIEAGGSIEIDGVDIRSISLQTLRESLAIIPQDPVLFAGSVSSNLDATGRASAEDMWIALESSSPGLAEKFRKSPGGLETYVSEGGKNLSLGERQLICLARALLRKSKILALDEATSSVDSKTDQEVQDTIRREFVEKGVTVITVAHRLETVLGYDKIAVLGDGEVLEYGSPSDLLRIPNGALSQLVEADRQNKARGGAAKNASTTTTTTDDRMVAA